MKPLTLGTRGSDLALTQSRLVASALRAAHPDLRVQEKIIRTVGDRRLDVPLHAVGPLDKGLFTKELEEALLDGTIDFAVHSLKDLPTENPPGLVLAAILERADPADLLVSKTPGGLDGLPPHSTVGTSSPRRKNQLLHFRPDLTVVDIRGNVPTRLRKLAESDTLAATVLAKAGLDRLGHDIIPPQLHATVITEMLPAPGQGAIAVQTRDADTATRALFQPLHHEDTARCVTAERDVLRQQGGGCHLPLGVLATINDGNLTVTATLFHHDGPRQLLNPKSKI
ncbi:MAG: hydroxymethylbilane synthase [Chthoniobacterales bacterium]